MTWYSVVTASSRRSHLGLTCLVVSLLLAVSPARGELARYEATAPAMGTTFHIALYAPDDATAATAIKAAFVRIKALDRMMSDYDPASELSQLGAASPTKKPVRVSDELFEVFTTAQHISRQSNGAFDITVGPLTRLWRQSRREKKLPDDATLKQALASVGYEKLKLFPESQSVALTAPGMQLDLGGIAKGYATDEALKVLQEHGIARAMISGGGGLTLGDAPPDSDGWKIGIAPLEPEAKPSIFLRLQNCGIATSGDAWQFVEIDGRRYSHIVDPTTGLGLTERMSVTVIAPTGMLADALSKPLCILGPDKGLQFLAGHEDAHAFMLHARNGTLEQHASPGFAQLRRAK
jgi:thiamine biosynthesis lipoprotein